MYCPRGVSVQTMARPEALFTLTLDKFKKTID